MKIGFHGCDLPEGKHKYDDPRMAALVGKFSPKKVTPYYIEICAGGVEQMDCILAMRDAVLDVLIPDIEFCESRGERAEDPAEKQLLEKCQVALEDETPLCHVNFTDEEKLLLQGWTLVTRTPVVILDDPPMPEDAIEKGLAGAGIVFFYTAGPKEVHAWAVEKDADIVTCAGTIHSDLARGFIRADVVSFDDMMTAHNFNDAKAKGLCKQVGKDYTIQPGDIIEVHFSV